MQEYLNQVVYGNSMMSYLLFVLSLVLGYFGLSFFRTVFLNYAKKITKKTNVEFRLLDLLAKRMVPILFCVIFYLSTRELVLAPGLRDVLDKAMLSFGVFLIAWLLSSVASLALGSLFEKHFHESKDASIINTLKGTVSVLIWILSLIVLFDNLGLNITSLVAGLGIGGVALAFAAQSILIDLFCWFSIVFDKPFVVGDYIIIGDKSGTVESIGVKTSRLRSLNGEQIILSNSDLTQSRINNFKTLVERRALFRLGVTYDTPSEDLKRIPELIKTLVEETEDTRFGRAHFVAYGAYSLDFEIVYFVLSSDYAVYLDRVQSINLKIKTAFEAFDIKFAYPTQMMFVQSSTDSKQ